MLIDSHCHLDYFSVQELPTILTQAAAVGVKEVVTIGTTLAQSKGLLSLTEAHDALWCTIGVHPHHVAQAAIPDPETLASMTAHPNVIGIGESGLDYFYNKAPRDMQAESFIAHIRGARLAGVPLCIHARDADDDIAQILRDEKSRGGDFTFLLHCFSSSRKLAEEAVEMGGFFSFSGILTFNNSVELREIARGIPADRLLVETDSPYLAPAPLRGKRNEPAYVIYTARTLAEIRGVSLETVAELTTQNFRRLFSKAKPRNAV